MLESAFSWPAVFYRRNRKLSLAILTGVFILAAINPAIAGSGASTSRDAGLGATQLEQIIQRVRDHYPQLKKQAAALDEAKADHQRARAGYLPSVHAGLGAATSNDPVAVFGMKLRQGAFTMDDFQVGQLNSPDPRTNFNATIGAEVPLFDSMQTIGMVETTSHLIRSQQELNRMFAMQGDLLALDGYLQLVLAESLERLTAETLAEADKDLQEALELKEQGLVLGADFYAGRVIHTNIEARRNQLTVARKRNASVLNVLQGQSVAEGLTAGGKIPRVNQTINSAAGWILQAHQSRPDLAALDAMIAAQVSETKRVRSDWMPDVRAFGEVQGNTNDFDDGGASFLVGVKGSIALWDPSRKSRISAQAARAEKLVQEQAALRDAISQSVAEAAAAYDGLVANIPLSAKATVDAAEAVEATRTLYREGRKSIADLQEIRMMHLDSQVANRKARVQAELARVRLLFLSGQLDNGEIRRIAERVSN